MSPRLLTLAAAALLAGCARPTADPAKLEAIRAESRALMARPAGSDGEVARRDWPPVIAGLRPERVTVYASGVDITIEPDFDGGWGYFVPRSEREPPGPPSRFTALGHGVYWCHPH